MTRRRSRPLARAKYTPEQESILAGIDRRIEGWNENWIRDQIRWRRELVERYNAEIKQLEAEIPGKDDEPAKG
jgi:hypothetical protein